MILLFQFSFSISSCKKNEETEDTSLGTANVRVFRNGVLLTEYSDTYVRGTLDGGDLSVEFTSSGNDHVLALTINDFKTGTFPVKDMYEPASAHLLYYSEELPEFSPGNIGLFNFPEGTLTLTVTNNRCSGTFNANGVHGGDNQNYSIEGTFEFPFIEI